MIEAKGGLSETTDDYEIFMQTSDSTYCRALDHLVDRVKPEEAFDLMASCNNVADIIEKEAADLVLVPQRGAGPIALAAREILMGRRDKLPYFVDLPIGTHSNVETHKEGHLRPAQKTRLVGEVFEDLKKQGLYVPGDSKILLVDEVQTGGTLTKATQAAKSAMAMHGDKSTLSVVAIQDSRCGQNALKKAANYKRLVANEIKGVKTFVVPTSLFTIDRSVYLDAIASDIRHNNPSDETLSSYFKIIENREAQRLFKALAQAFMQPLASAQELALLGKEELLPDLSSAIIQYVIADAMTDPRKVDKRAEDAQILTWWSVFLGRVMAKSLSSLAET